MGWFSAKPYQRRDALTAASEAQRKKKPKKAIAEYERIIEHDGEDPMVLHKLATCLAEVQRVGEARTKFLTAATTYEGQGFVDKALAVYVTAAHYLPGDRELWEIIAERQLEKGRRAEAIKVLLDARRHFPGKKKRDDRIHLLGQIRTIEPWHFEGGLALAKELRAVRRQDEARALLDGLAERNRGRKLRKVRWALFSMSPTPSALWRWLRAFFG